MTSRQVREVATGLHFQPTSLDLGRVMSEKQKTGGIACRAAYVLSTLKSRVNGRVLRAQRGTKIMSMTQQVSGWIALIGIWRRRSRNRRELAAMSNQELQDIGITAWEAGCEANKPFWRE